MAHMVCPVWIGRLLLNPFRRLLENPDKLFGPFVRPGMTVLEPGCGLGYFTLPLARMVGPEGRVVAVDVQQAMLDGLQKRAERAGLSARIDARPAGPDGMDLTDLSGRVDFGAALHMVHEVPDQEVFFRAAAEALKPGARLLMVEPRGHTGRGEFERFLATAAAEGLQTEEAGRNLFVRRAVLAKR